MAVGIAGLVLSAASMAMSAMQSSQQQQAQKSLLDAQAEAQGMQAQTQKLASRQKAAYITDEEMRTRSSMMAQAASAGVTLDSESFLGVVQESASMAERDRTNVLLTGRLEEGASLARANMYGYQANVAGDTMWGTTGSLLSGAGSLLSGADKLGFFSGPSTTTDPGETLLRQT